MKDLFFLQRKTWFQFRKTCKKLGLKTSISSKKKTWWCDERLFLSSTKDLISIQRDLKKSCYEDFHIFNERLDDLMKDLYFLQRKTWFQFRKTCKNLGLKTSFSSKKDLMMWWKTCKILVWRLSYLQRKTWWCHERLIYFFNKRLDDVMKDLFFL